MSLSLNNRTALGLEPLEGRDVMSVSVLGIGSGNALTFTGDGVNDFIEILDAGGSGNTQIQFRLTPNGLFQPVVNPISTITIDTKGGNDTVIYTMTGNMQNGFNSVDRDVLAYMGAGTSDTFQANVRSLNANAKMRVQAIGQAGDDVLKVQTQPGCVLNTGSVLSVGMDGGTGFDEVSVDAWTNSTAVRQGAAMSVNLAGLEQNVLSGDTNDNRVSLWYRGELDGNIQFRLFGADGTDYVNVTMDLAADTNGATTGTIGDANKWGTNSGAFLRGGDNDDSVDLMVRGTYAELDGIFNPYLDGGYGEDAMHQAINGLHVIPYFDPRGEDHLVLC